MSITAQKARAPIASSIVSPINESVTFTPGNTIIFRIGPSDILHWLVQDSYFTFDVEWVETPGAAAAPADTVIRGSGMFFDTVQILHAGNQVYYQQYNIAQQFMDYVKSGQQYLNANYNEWTTHETYNKVKTSLERTPLVMLQDEWAVPAGGANRMLTKKGVVLRVGQILKCLSQCESFPLKYLTQQIEIRLQIAKVDDFLCSVSNDAFLAAADTHNNFYPVGGNNGVTGAGANTTEGALANKPTFTINNMRLYMFGEDIDPGYDATLRTDFELGAGKVWRYLMPRFNLRNMTAAANPAYQIANFQCITENTDKLFIYAVRGTNLASTIRPHVTNMNLRFGPYQMPKSPTQEDNWTKPALYKTLVDDTLEYSTAYYTSGNYDLRNSYAPLSQNDQLSVANAGDRYCTEHDTHIVLAGSFTTDDGKLGSNSKAWNSQYNLHYNLVTPEPAWTWVLAVDTEYVLTLRNGMLSSTNL